MSHEEVTDKLKGNHPGFSESQKATFSPGPRPDRDAVVSSQSPPPPQKKKQKHRRGGDSMSNSSRSQSWNNHAVISVIQLHQVWADLWVISYLITPHAAVREWRYLPRLCVAETWRQTRIDQTEALHCSTARCLRDVIRIQSPQCFYVPIKKEGARFLKCQRTYTANWKPLPFQPAQWSKTFHLPPLIYYDDYSKNPSRY